MVDAEVKKTFSLLTTPVVEPLSVPSMSDSDYAARTAGRGDTWRFPRVVTRDRVSEEIRRAVRELFPKGGYDDEARYRAFFPSTSANYIRSRNGKGAIGSLLEDHADLFEGLRLEDGGVQLLRTIDREESRRLGATDGLSVDDTRLRDHFRVFMDRLLVKAYREGPETSLLGLSEAFKVRVISKMPPWFSAQRVVAAHS
jgi:hypothetical protein